MDLKETDVLGDDIGAHWYYASKARAMARLLQGAPAARILDVGAGSGFFSRYLLANTGARSACCVDISYPREWEETEAGKPIAFRRDVASSDADLVLLMDVLEHVDDDVGLLKQYVDKSPPGARFLISIPAFQFLWSGHDVFLEHKRRYRLPEIEQVVARAGLALDQGVYYFGGVFPLAAFLRKLPQRNKDQPPASQLKRHSALVNGVLKAVCAAELALMKNNRLAGLTIFCLAHK